MLLLLFSGLFSLLFGAVLCFTLNYIIYQWESTTIDNLAKQAKADTTDSILSKNTATRSFTTSFTAIDRNPTSIKSLGQNISQNISQTLGQGIGQGRSLVQVADAGKYRSILGGEAETEGEEKTNIFAKIWQVLRKTYSNLFKFVVKFKIKFWQIFSPKHEESLNGTLEDATEVGVIPKATNRTAGTNFNPTPNSNPNLNQGMGMGRGFGVDFDEVREINPESSTYTNPQNTSKFGQPSLQAGSSSNYSQNVQNEIHRESSNENKTDLHYFEQDEVLSMNKTQNSQNSQNFNSQNNDKTTGPNNNTEATLNLAGQGEQRPEKDMSLFEKLEQKLVDSLQNEGLNHYDIWLDLGQLYQKYDENQKAKEVYALVMKNATGDLKDRAKNCLVGLN